jgi:hypothetical protein
MEKTLLLVLVLPLLALAIACGDDGAATVDAAVSQSDVSWEIRLEQRAGVWSVVEATYTGCC